MTHALADSTSVRRRQSAALPWLAVVVWLGFTAFAFGFFHGPSGQSTRLFDAAGHAREAEAWFRTLNTADSANASPAATVVHVSRGACDCNRFTEPHLRQIEAKYRSRGVRFVRAAGERPAWIESTPAALVFDHHGRLAYFGPYSDAAWCSAAGGLVERTLDTILNGKAPLPQQAYARGCFCDSGKLPTMKGF